MVSAACPDCKIMIVESKNNHNKTSVTRCRQAA